MTSAARASLGPALGLALGSPVAHAGQFTFGGRIFADADADADLTQLYLDADYAFDPERARGHRFRSAGFGEAANPRPPEPSPACRHPLPEATSNNLQGRHSRFPGGRGVHAGSLRLALRLRPAGYARRERAALL